MEGIWSLNVSVNVIKWKNVEEIRKGFTSYVLEVLLSCEMITA